MSEGTVSDDGRYWAFISYSHKDAVFGRRLHRRLEAYALPRRLVGRATAQGAASRRLTPIFRDREELPAANDLSAEVRAALKASRCLIVVCSPAAAVSPWVAREVELFRELHPGRPILAAVREGDPATSIPDVIRRLGPDGARVEPLAADFRRGHDGWELGLLKLVAGVVGVGLDELVQRDSQRRTQRVTAVTAGALAAMLVMVVLTVIAMNARSEAERQRTEAEGLVEFMLTDLRTELKGVGRLDVLTTVNQRALKYYSDQDLERLPPDSLERRARILHAMGADDETRGDHDAALREFGEARRTTAALLAAAPDDPARIFAQAQSEYGFGLIAYERDRVPEAIAAFTAYKRLADKLVAMAPDNPKYQREAGYADGNFCTVALVPPEHPADALKFCKAALAHMEAAAHRIGATSDMRSDLVNRHAWLADAFLKSGNKARARSERLVEERMLDALIAGDPKNLDYRDTWLSLQRAFANLDRLDGRFESAIDRLKRALPVVDDMIRQDPTNKLWSQKRARILANLSKLQQENRGDSK